MFRIIIIEDDTSSRNELALLLTNALYEVICIEHFTAIENQIQNANPDLVLLDMNLPDKSGIEICTELRKTSDVPIIFVTSDQTASNELNCLMRGGDDYITKPYLPPLLLVRIATILKRTANNSQVERSRLSHRGVTLDLASATIEFADQKVDLTKNELKILHYLFLHTDCFLSRSTICDYLWDNQVFIDDNTLSVNIRRIRAKLEQIGIHEYIETKRGIGYKI
jgi:DNA-binding response OmpR family regulator